MIKNKKKNPNKLPDFYRFGPFRLCHENVEFFIVPDMCGGEFFFCPSEKDFARIKVGIGSDWSETLSWVLHETMEFAMTRAGVRFASTNKISGDHAAFLFSFDHQVFHQCISGVSEFLESAIPILREKFEKHTGKNQLTPDRPA